MQLLSPSNGHRPRQKLPEKNSKTKKKFLKKWKKLFSPWSAWKNISLHGSRLSKRKTEDANSCELANIGFKKPSLLKMRNPFSHSGERGREVTQKKNYRFEKWSPTCLPAKRRCMSQLCQSGSQIKSLSPHGVCRWKKKYSKIEMNHRENIKWPRFWM